MIQKTLGVSLFQNIPNINATSYDLFQKHPISFQKNTHTHPRQDLKTGVSEKNGEGA